MVAAARKQILEIDAEDVFAQLDHDGVLVVDIRDIRERQRDGFIPGSFHCPRGMAEFWVDPDSPYYKPVFSEEKTFIFHCASGWRSALTVQTLQGMGMTGIAHMTHGFGSWKKMGGPISFPKK
ncbi:MAG: rhodanese-like domain-containing protein [Arenicella sp.]